MVGENVLSCDLSRIATVNTVGRSGGLFNSHCFFHIKAIKNNLQNKSNS